MFKRYFVNRTCQLKEGSQKCSRELFIEKFPTKENSLSRRAFCAKSANFVYWYDKYIVLYSYSRALRF